MSIRYEIQNNILYVFDENNVCFLAQETHPSGTPWHSIEQIEAWYQEFLDRFIDDANKPHPEVVPIPEF